MNSKILIFSTLTLFANGAWAADNNTPDPAGGQSSINAANAQPASASSEALFARWLDLNALSFSFRFRDQAENVGFHVFEYGQERSLIDGKVKLDRQGKFSVNFHVSSGGSFNWAYADVIGGTFGGQDLRGAKYFNMLELQQLFASAVADPIDFATGTHLKSGGWSMRTRQLYLSASPIKQLEFDYGSLPIAKGFDTEMTTYDDDGYIAGERLRILDPKHLCLDEVSATFAYEGDIYDPNFFTRGNRLLQSNYHQFLIAKRLGKRFGLSADYTGDKSTHTFRQGVLVATSETHVLDSVRLETYQRTNDVTIQGAVFQAGSGFGFTGSKTLAKRVRIEAGYADIDHDYGALVGSRLLATFGFSMNGDQYLVGKRAFTRANIKLTPYFSLFGYYSHLTTPFSSLNLSEQSFNFGGTLDFQNILANKLHLIEPVKSSN